MTTNPLKPPALQLSKPRFGRKNLYQSGIVVSRKKKIPHGTGYLQWKREGREN
jgi:hypothetical protein